MCMYLYTWNTTQLEKKNIIYNNMSEHIRFQDSRSRIDTKRKT